MSNQLSVSVIGLAAISARLDLIANALNTRDILDEAGALLFNRLRTRFIQETDPDGNHWRESRAAARRRMRGRGGGTLYETGRLFRSLQLSAINANESRISTDVAYAAANNTTRRFMGFGDGDITVAQRLIIKRIEQALV